MITVKAKSVNGKREYEAEVDVDNYVEARAVLSAQVIKSIRAEFGVTPEGVGYLVDPRTAAYTTHE